MTVAPAKSSVTLLTPDRHEHNVHPHTTLNSQTIPLNRNPKILGLTFDPHLTFTPHTNLLISKAHRRLRALKALTGTTYGQSKESITTLYKQYIRTLLTYASPAWSSITSTSNTRHLQTIQNAALRIATGCTQPTDIPHLHHETKVLTLHQHLDMRGTQFIAQTLNKEHTCHPLHDRPTRSRHKKADPITYYIGILNSLPPIPEQTSSKQHIHTALTKTALSNASHNKVLRAPPPKVSRAEALLPRHTSTTLSQLETHKHHSLSTPQRQTTLSQHIQTPHRPIHLTPLPNMPRL